MMADKVGIALEATGADQFARSMQTITQRSKELASELKAVTAAFDKTDTSEAKLTAQSQVLQKQIDNQKAKIEQLSAKYQVQVTELDKLRTELEQAVAAHGKDSAEAAKAAQAYDKQTRAVSTTKTQLNNAEAALSTMTRQLESNNTAVKKAEAEQKSLSSTIQDQRSRLGELKTAYAEAVAQYGKHSTEAKGLAKEIKSLSSELKDNESTMQKADTAADKLDKTMQKTESGMKKVADSAKKAGEGFTVMKGVIADLVSSAIKTAISSIGNLASSLMDLVESTQEYRSMQATLAGAANTFGYALDFVKSQYADFYAYLADDQMATNAITNLLGLGVTTDIVSDLATAAAAVWSAYGDSIPIESLTESVNESAQVAQVTGVLADALNWAGISEDSFNERLAALSTTQERADLIAQTLNNTYGDSLSLYDSMTQSMQAANTAALNYKETQAELAAIMEPISTKITEIKSTLLKALAPAIETAADRFISLADSIDWTAWGEAIGAGVETITGYIDGLKFEPIDFDALVSGVITGIEAMVAAAKKIIDAVQWVIDNWGTVKAILTGVAAALAAIKIAQFAAAIVSLANPITAVIALVSALAIGVATHLDEIKAWFQGAAIAIKAGWQAVGDFFTGLWDGIKQTYADVKEFFGSAFTAAKDSIETAFATIGDFFTGVWTGIQTVFSTVQDWFGEKFNAAKTAVTNAFSTVVSFYSGIWTGIKNVFSAVGSWFGEKFNAAKSAVTNAFSTVVSFFSRIWNGIKNAFSGAREGFANIGQQMISGISDAVNFFKNLPSQALQWGKDLLGNFIDGIKSKFSALTNAVSSAAGKVRSFLHFSQPDEGPLSDFNTYAPDMMALYAKGIRANIPMVQSALDQMTGQMADTILTNQAAAAQGATVTTTNMGGVTITINAHEGQSPQEIADVVMERIQHAVSQKEAVFA